MTDYDLLLPADLVRGEYELIVHLAVCAGQPLDECAARALATATVDSGVAIGGSAVITTLRVEAR